MFRDFLSHQIYHYNHKRFWKWRNDVVDESRKQCKLVKLIKLIYLKRCEAFNNAYLGTTLGGGATFETPPILPHYLNGIIVSCYAKIGKNCTILQQVTIGQVRLNDPHVPVIG